MTTRSLDNGLVFRALCFTGTGDVGFCESEDATVEAAILGRSKVGRSPFMACRLCTVRAAVEVDDPPFPPGVIIADTDGKVAGQKICC